MQPLGSDAYDVGIPGGDSPRKFGCVDVVRFLKLLLHFSPKYAILPIIVPQPISDDANPPNHHVKPVQIYKKLNWSEDLET